MRLIRHQVGQFKLTCEIPVENQWENYKVYKFPFIAMVSKDNSFTGPSLYFIHLELDAAKSLFH
jgi:hypothetical protein